MNIIDEIKLEIYESALDAEDKEELLDIVESSQDDPEVLHSVVDVLESVSEDSNEEVSDSDTEFYESVLEMLEAGEISVEEAAELL